MAIKRKSPSETFRSNRGAERSKQQLVLPHKNARPWSDLPDDILELITDKFSITDLTRFQLVCKNWNSFHRTRPLHDQHPWLLCFDDNGYRLHEPYSHLKTTKSDFDLNSFHVCASKKGCLLLRLRSSPSTLIAYNPFTTKRVTLPPMEFKFASFSTEPSDPDCVFFAVDDDPLEGTMIGIWRPDDENWTVLKFAGFHEMKNSVFIRGSFYCSNHRGLIGVFSLEDRSWQIMEETKPVFYALLSPYESHLVEFNGRILLVLLRTMHPCATSVHELDFSKKEWVRKEGLEETAVFLNESVAMATAASVTKSKNRVYYINGAECRFCCLAGNATTRSYKSAKPYRLAPDEEVWKKLWIEPPYSEGFK